MEDFDTFLKNTVAGILPTVFFYLYALRYSKTDTLHLKPVFNNEGISITRSKELALSIFRRNTFFGILMLGVTNIAIMYLQYGDFFVYVTTLIPLGILCGVGYSHRRPSWAPWGGIFATSIIGGHVSFFISPYNPIISFVIGTTISIPIVMILYQISKTKFNRDWENH